jgi:hypothetical protein
MSIYYDASIEGTYTCTAWHPQKSMLAAAGKAPSVIDVYSAEGDLLDSFSDDVSQIPNKLRWNPVRTQLIIGWPSGMKG